MDVSRNKIPTMKFFESLQVLKVESRYFVKDFFIIQDYISSGDENKSTKIVTRFDMTKKMIMNI